MVASVIQLRNQVAPSATSADRAQWRTIEVRYAGHAEVIQALAAETPSNEELLRWSNSPRPKPGSGWWIDDVDPFLPESE